LPRSASIHCEQFTLAGVLVVVDEPALAKVAARIELISSEHAARVLRPKMPVLISAANAATGEANEGVGQEAVRASGPRMLSYGR
jgi:hypothetical protein